MYLKIIAPAIILLMLSACAPGQFIDRHNGVAPEMSFGNFEFVGCYTNTHEKYVVGPFGLNNEYFGDLIFFKQRDNDGASNKEGMDAIACTYRWAM